MHSASTHDKPIVKVDGLAKSFAGNPVLKSVSLQVGKGEVVVIMGPSGSGKTTFIRSLNFLEMPDSGAVEVCGIAVAGAGPRPEREARKRIQAIRQRTAMVFQSFNLFPHMTALENVIEGLVSVRGMPKEQARTRGRVLLDKVELGQKADAYPSRLSGGQKQRVAIARALAMEPEVIYFDEPTSALDPELRDDVLKVMRDLADDGMTMLVVTHEARFARDVADRVIFMEDGHVLEDTTPAEFFGPHASERTRRFLGRIGD
ncbi:amino acid ABC transporter ATP-binding protein [Xylophilus sp.]|uniref:amino acid ABC transporter ATP-binding protein n=1 Tax=Xylophilus sp. TaxID=2653893 RepID=UPI0013BC7A37|nr:amino acid ABC transporter ATP-binding protein [Xylophilus sp.]KAF1049826.1 MAG: L-cystine import ATP-binding protein TcyC [Xylophilus sp.]